MITPGKFDTQYIPVWLNPRPRHHAKPLTLSFTWMLWRTHWAIKIWRSLLLFLRVALVYVRLFAVAHKTLRLACEWSACLPKFAQAPAPGSINNHPCHHRHGLIKMTVPISNRSKACVQAFWINRGGGFYNWWQHTSKAQRLPVEECACVA